MLEFPEIVKKPPALAIWLIFLQEKKRFSALFSDTSTTCFWSHPDLSQLHNGILMLNKIPQVIRLLSRGERPIQEQFWLPMECVECLECLECLECVTSLVTKVTQRVFYIKPLCQYCIVLDTKGLLFSSICVNIVLFSTHTKERWHLMTSKENVTSQWWRVGV